MRKGLLIGLVGAVVGVIGWGGFNTVLEATNTMPFCVSCHVMADTVYVEYQASPHFRNPSGVRATCPDCHVPRDWTHKLLRKAQATNELFHWAVGSIDTKEKFAEKRHALAVREWERMRGSDSRECRNCHSFDAMDFHRQNIRAARAMRDAEKDGKTCIDCHKGVAHTIPDVNARHRKMLAAVVETAKAHAPKPGETLYPAVPLPFRLDGPPRADVPADGEVLAATPVQVLAVEGTSVRIAVAGWVREGVGTALYSRLGLRQAVAMLGEQTLGRLQPVSTAVDPDTEENWSEVRLEAWTRADAFLSDRAPLWEVARQINQDACSLCHLPRQAKEFDGNRWIGNMNNMKRQTALTEPEAQLLLSYMQSNAKGAR